jgi:hypothetical protein
LFGARLTHDLSHEVRGDTTTGISAIVGDQRGYRGVTWLEECSRDFQRENARM